MPSAIAFCAFANAAPPRAIFDSPLAVAPPPIAIAPVPATASVAGAYDPVRTLIYASSSAAIVPMPSLSVEIRLLTSSIAAVMVDVAPPTRLFT
ncbi:hypothetical protein [Burkholderia ubonensis]|uniref:hypothetical protein n=1 Tax=Burkholderia ubonensis TaxID=101571 RepID=UPI0018E034A2|nr:hypothetical protein [Burkholderia ubonensis]